MRVSIAILLLLLPSWAFAQGRGTVTYVPTVTELTNRVPSALNPSVLVAGYATNGDWGPARAMRYDAGATNAVDNGCVFPTSTGTGRWMADDCDGPQQDVRWWGIFGDGTTDNTAALDNAIQALSAAGGATLVFPPGVYLTDRVGIRQRVNLVGAGVNFASVGIEADPLPLGASVIQANPGASGPFLYNVPGAGELYQLDQALFDGSTNTAWLYQAQIRGLSFYGDGENQTANNLDGVFLNGAWSIQLIDCSFAGFPGYQGRFRDVNEVNPIHTKFIGHSLNGRSKGVLIEQAADNSWVDTHIAQVSGPAMALYSASFNTFNGLYQFGGVYGRRYGAQYWTTNFDSATVASDTITIPGVGHPFETGDLVTFNKNTNSLTGVSSWAPYYVYKVNSNQFTVHSNYRLATNGTALPLTAGSGSIDVTIGPNSGLLLGYLSYLNGFSDVHLDENTDGALWFRESYNNTVAGLLAHRNAGTPGYPAASNITAGITFQGGFTRGNRIVGGIVFDATNGVLMSENTSSNRIIGVEFGGVMTNFVGGAGNFIEARQDAQYGWIENIQPNANPNLRLARVGSAAMDIAMSGSATAPIWIFREPTNTVDLLRLGLDAGGISLGLGGTTYSASSTNRPVAVYGVTPTDGTLTDAPAYPMTFRPTLGTGSGSITNGYFVWRLPTNGPAATTKHADWSAMTLTPDGLDLAAGMQVTVGGVALGGGSGSITADGAAISNLVSSATITNAVSGGESTLSVVDGSIGATQLGAITSAELASKVSDETGSGALVFAGGNIGAATATSLDASGALSAASATLTSTNLNRFYGGIISTGQFLHIIGNADGKRNFPAVGAGIELLYSPTQYVALPAWGRGELQLYDRDASRYTDFRFNSRVMGFYGSGTLIAYLTNGLFDLTGAMQASGAVTSGGTNLHTLPHTLDAAVKAERLWQATNSYLTDLSGAGTTGSGAFVRADSPTFAGTVAFDGLDVGTLNATNATFTTQSQGDNSTKAATTAYVDTALGSAGGGFDPFTIARTLAYGYYEFVGNTVASAVIPWNSAAVSSGATIQFTPTAAYPDPGQIGFRSASGTALNTGAILTAAADTLWFTNDWAFECSLFTTKTNGSMWRVGINSSQNSTVPTDQFSFTITNNQCYPTAFSNTIVTLGTPYTLEINTPYTLRAKATNQGGAHFQIWTGGDLVASNDMVTGLPWQRNISMGVMGLNSSVENTNSTTFLRVGCFGWTNWVSR